MQGLNNLTKGELLDLVRAFEERIAELEGAGGHTRGAQLGVDFIYGQALLVLGNSGIAAFIYDTGIDPHGREFAIVGANQSMAAFTGYLREELVGMSVTSLLA